MRICIIKILSYRHKNIKYSYIEYFEEAKFCFNIKKFSAVKIILSYIEMKLFYSLLV